MPPAGSASSPTSSTHGPNGATSPHGEATPGGCGSTSPPTSSARACGGSPAHTSSPKQPETKPHNAWKGKQYEAHVPAVADRIAQTVVAGVREGRAERLFHPDSYGYRPKRSALDAVAACRRRWDRE